MMATCREMPRYTLLLYRGITFWHRPNGKFGAYFLSHAAKSSSAESQAAVKKSSAGATKTNWNNDETLTDDSTPLIIKHILKNDEERSSSSTSYPYHKAYDSHSDISLGNLQKEIEAMEWDMDARFRSKLDVDDATNIQPSSSDHISTSQYNDDLFVDDVDSDEQKLLTRLQVGKPKVEEVNEKPITRLSNYYTDLSVPVSDIQCLGCGAKLHCQDPAIPGFVAAEIFTQSTRDKLLDMKCRRCFLMGSYNRCLEVKCPEQEFNEIMKSIRMSTALVVHIVDLADFPASFIRDLPNLAGRRKQFYIVGNKVDLIPKGSQRDVEGMLGMLRETCERNGIGEELLRHVCLISAKTGYGVEKLITKLMSDWRKKGSIYLVGCTNAGKSTLFNSLVSSDFCKSHVRDLVHRATVSIWPGTTMGVLKFPIITPTFWRLKQRTLRLADDSGKREADWLKRYHVQEKDGPLFGHVGKTDFAHKTSTPPTSQTLDDHGYMSAVSSYEMKPDGTIALDVENQDLSNEDGGESVHHLYNQLTDSDWCYDTPGLISSAQVLRHLSTEELKVILPKSTLEPRTVHIQPGQVLFVSGLVRLDYIQGEKTIQLTVVAPATLPLHMGCATRADSHYMEHVGTRALGVPLGDSKRLDRLPSLIGRKFHVQGQGWKSCAADITLPSIGWVSITTGETVHALLRVYTVGGEGCALRTPSMLPALAIRRRKHPRKKIVSSF